MARGHNERGQMPKRRKRVLVAINTLTSIGRAPYMDHMLLYYSLGRYYRNYDFHQMVSDRVSIDRFRNTAANIALQSECDYLMFIDDDMLLPKDTFGKLVAAKLDIVAAHTYIRGYPFKLMAFKVKKEGKKVTGMVNLTQDDLKDAAASGKDLIKCDAIGTAVCLIKIDVFRRTPPAWFVTGTHNTEDIYFCCKAREYFPKTTIGMIPSLITGHVLAPEVINFYTRPALMEYTENFMTDSEIEQVRNEGIDHGVRYIEKNLEESLIQTENIALLEAAE